MSTYLMNIDLAFMYNIMGTQIIFLSKAFISSIVFIIEHKSKPLKDNYSTS